MCPGPIKILHAKQRGCGAISCRRNAPIANDQSVAADCRGVGPVSPSRRDFDEAFTETLSTSEALARNTAILVQTEQSVVYALA